MGADSGGADLDEIRLERDFYQRLVEVGTQTELEPFLKEALKLVTDITGAQQGYLELHGAPEDVDYRWSIADGFSVREIEEVRSRISGGIIAEALATGQIVETSSAMLDPRFLERKSIQELKIEAVLCAPIGSDPPLGVLYLQGRDAPGRFSAEDCERARLFAHHLAPLADNVVLRRRTRDAEDPTAPFRRALAADGVVGSSAALAGLLREVSLIVALDVPVLLTGGPGTGKNRIARLIHESGSRAGSPLVEVDCTAFPETLVESELFGAEAGADSAATARTEGKVAAAEGGTLVLNEIGELPQGAQSKLLVLLQTKQVQPLGASQPRAADIRLIAATSADLDEAVRDGRFREDLHHRLAVLQVRVPALTERGSDASELTRHFCANACEQHGLQRLELSRAALRAVESAEWPGNVRQLQRVVEAGAIRAAGAGAKQLERQHLFPDEGVGPAPGEQEATTLQEATRRFQADLVRKTLEETGWNVAEAARSLDVARAHLDELISAFGIDRTRG
jgi:Nif-specific regulatory protein